MMGFASLNLSSDTFASPINNKAKLHRRRANAELTTTSVAEHPVDEVAARYLAPRRARGLGGRRCDTGPS